MTGYSFGLPPDGGGGDVTQEELDAVAAAALAKASNLSDLANAATARTNIGLGNVTNTSDANKPVSTAQQTALDLKAPIASPPFTGTVAGVSRAMVGLGNVDNTTDANKPVSTAAQAALDLKAPLASPTFTGTVAGVTKAMVGLGSVDNTADTAKPVSTATQTALDLKAAKTDLPYLNVKDAAYGAVGDNTNDDTAEIQAAIDAASAAGGGTVWFPKGDYKISAALTVPSKVHLRGAGPLVSKIRTTTNNHNCVSMSGASALSTVTQIRIADLGIIGPGKTSGSTGYGIYLKWGSAGLTFDNLYVADHGSHGVYVEDTYTASWRDVWITGNGGDGWHGETNINHTVWSRCFSTVNGGAGYKVIGGAASVFTACDAEENQTAGIDLRYTTSYSVVGAELEENGKDGTSPQIYLHWRSGAGEKATMTTITGSLLAGAGVSAHGIVVDGANLTDIRGNTFSNHTGNHVQTTSNASRTLVGINTRSGTGTELTDASASTARLDYDDTNLTLRVSPALRLVPGGAPASLAEGQVWFSSTAPGGLLVRDSAATRTVWSGWTAAATLDFGSIAAGASASLTMTVTGAVISMPVALGAPANLEAGLLAFGLVTATNTVTVRLFNSTASAIDPVSNTWRAFVGRVA